MQHNRSLATPAQHRGASGEKVDKRALTESVAYALWEDRKRRNVPDDPQADWYRAEELITELWNLRPPEMN